MGRHLKVMLSAALAAAVLCSVIPGSVPTAAQEAEPDRIGEIISGMTIEEKAA